jgi:transposase-like protein
VRRAYQKNPRDREVGKLRSFFAANSQLFLPLLELIEESSSLIGDVLDRVNQGFIEGLLDLSVLKVAGPAHRGRAGGPIRRHGRQRGVVTLSERKLRVSRPRLRHREGGEVEVPAYESLQSDTHFLERVKEILLKGVSTRDYESVIGELAETVGVSKSSVSREFIEASSKSLEELAARRFEDVDLLVIYVDGVRYGEHHVIAALGVDAGGKKHVLGLVPGASENSVAVQRLLTDLVDRGVDPSTRYLWVIDGSKALRGAIREVFGETQAVQRCRLHKIRNVRKELPDDLADQVASVMKAAFSLDPKQGKAKLEKQAQWLEKEYPGAAASLREGMDELFTMNALGLPSTLTRCLASTNIIESPFGTMQKPLRRITRWRHGEMVTRWAASSFLAAEKRFRRIMGHGDLWILAAALGRKEVVKTEEAA